MLCTACLLGCLLGAPETARALSAADGARYG